MSDLLYMRDNYLREFNAVVQKVADEYIVLDQTAFYYLGGGQSSDQGILSSKGTTVKIHEVRKVEDEIRHFTKDSISFEVGTNVHGELDWEFRYECMRFHTAQHLLSRYLQLEHELITVGNMIKPGRSRADFTPLHNFDDDMKRSVEAGVNEILARELLVETLLMPRSEAVAFLNERGYQTRYLEMVPETVTEFRVLIIGDYDASSCAGTHVANTREIGAIQLGKSKNVGAGKQRIYFSLRAP
ncbi:MAG: alanyl-tRNA editing protein [Candidatus Thorarchaeota archaeon]|jgi:misacylated tRNA(Ala) deacylase